MKKFRYEAIDRKGNNIDGIMKANTFEEIVFHLLRDRCHPTRIEELTQQNFIALGRLENMKELRNRLQPKEDLPSIVVPRLSTRTFNRWAVPIIVLLWVVVFIAYLLIIRVS